MKLAGTIVINAVLFLLILSLAILEGPNTITNAATTPRTSVDPSSYNDLYYSTDSQAASNINTQLAGMGNTNSYGTIYQIDTQADEYSGLFFLDYEIGGVRYWEIGDEETEVYSDGVTREILCYYHGGWFNGSLTQQQIQDRAENIAEYFLGGSLPSDAENPWIYERVTLQKVVLAPDTGNQQTTNCRYWYVQFNRTKAATPDDIPTQDFIRLTLNPNGDLKYYLKVWEMDLSQLSTTYTVSQTAAETTALTYDGIDNSVYKTSKIIVRPDYFWPVAESPTKDGVPVVAYGLDPVIAWEIWVQDSSDNLCIYYVHGTENRVVGGDMIEEFFAEDTSET